MAEIKLLSLIQHLKREEWRAFKRQFSGKKSKALDLLEYIDKYLPHLEKNKAKLSPEAIFKRLFPKKVFPDERRSLDELLSRMFKQAENFLINKEIDRDKMLRDTLLSKALKNRGIDHLFELQSKKAISALKKAEEKDNEQYLGLFQLTKDAIFHRSSPKLNKEYGGQLLEMEAYLDKFYLLSKLRLHCEQKSVKGIIEDELKAPKIPLDTAIIQSQFSEEQSISLFFKMFQMLEKGAVKEGKSEAEKKAAKEAEKEAIKIYYDLKKELIDKDGKLKRLELKPETNYDLLIFLINFCNEKKLDNYKEEMLDLYDAAVKNNLLIEDGYISQSNFINFVMLLISAGKYDAAADFIEQHADQLKPKIKENCRNLAKAILASAQKDHWQTISMLQEVKWVDIAYKLRARNLLIMAYYELEEFLSLKNLLEACSKFIIRKELRLTPEVKEVNLNFYNLVRRMLAYKEKSTSKKKVPVLEGKVVLKDWCLEKLSDL